MQRLTPLKYFVVLLHLRWIYKSHKAIAQNKLGIYVDWSLRNEIKLRLLRRRNHDSFFLSDWDRSHDWLRDDNILNAQRSKWNKMIRTAKIHLLVSSHLATIKFAGNVMMAHLSRIPNFSFFQWFALRCVQIASCALPTNRSFKNWFSSWDKLKT